MAEQRQLGLGSGLALVQQIFIGPAPAAAASPASVAPVAPVAPPLMATAAVTEPDLEPDCEAEPEPSENEPSEDRAFGEPEPLEDEPSEDSVPAAGASVSVAPAGIHILAPPTEVFTFQGVAGSSVGPVHVHPALAALERIATTIMPKRMPRPKPIAPSVAISASAPSAEAAAEPASKRHKVGPAPQPPSGPPPTPQQPSGPPPVHLLVKGNDRTTSKAPASAATGGFFEGIRG